MEIKDRLTQMGVCLECDITMGWWIRRSAFHAIAYPFRQEGRKRSGKAHIPCDIGGYARQSVENASSSAIRGFDGVIHIYPSGCMPEIVSHAVLNRIGERENIRIMTLVCDEMSAEAGIMTRIRLRHPPTRSDRVKGADGS